MTLHLRPMTAGVVMALVVLASAIPAQATVVDQQHYSLTDSFPDVVCGVSVRHDVVESGVAHVRVAKGDLSSAFFGVDNYANMSTLTNEANGNFVRIEHNGVVVDTKGTHVSGSIFMFTTINAGQPIRIRDMTDRIVSRDRGLHSRDLPLRHPRRRHSGRVVPRAARPAGQRAASPAPRNLR